MLRYVRQLVSKVVCQKQSSEHSVFRALSLKTVAVAGNDAMETVRVK